MAAKPKQIKMFLYQSDERTTVTTVVTEIFPEVFNCTVQNIETKHTKMNKTLKYAFFFQNILKVSI
jgi:adenylate cyclase